jgi:hypothetical protein
MPTSWFDCKPKCVGCLEGSRGTVQGMGGALLLWLRQACHATSCCGVHTCTWQRLTRVAGAGGDGRCSGREGWMGLAVRRWGGRFGADAFVARPCHASSTCVTPKPPSLSAPPHPPCITASQRRVSAEPCLGEEGSSGYLRLWHQFVLPGNRCGQGAGAWHVQRASEGLLVRCPGASSPRVRALT